MGHKIFISYKYADDNVEVLRFNEVPMKITTVRDYVDILEEYFRNHSDHIYKGETDGEDLSTYAEDTIKQKLADRLADSSITIVLISQDMKECNKSERHQWIPWEISYSLKRENRNGRTIQSNAMLAIVLPNRGGNYMYCLEYIPIFDWALENTDCLFPILKNNVFNDYEEKNRGRQSGYIELVKWCDFCKTPEKYIDKAIDRQRHIDDYNIQKEILNYD